MSIQLCRVCITSNVRMHRIDSNRLQEMFEKVTNTKLHAGGRPVSICYICLSQLQKSQRFLEMCQRAEEMFADLITNGTEFEKHSIDMLNIGSVQHIALSVTSTQFITLNDYSNNESSQVTVKKEPSGLEENMKIVYIVRDEMDSKNFQIKESVLSNNTTWSVNLTESSQKAVKEEPSGLQENAKIVDFVKVEMDTENFQIEESVLSNNTTWSVNLTESSQKAVKEEPSGLQENAKIVDFVKVEMDTENFQIEESVLSNNTTWSVNLTESSQKAVKEEPSGLQENAKIFDFVKVEMDMENFQIEESVLSNNTTWSVNLTESSQKAVKEEPSRLKENAKIVNIVKVEMDTENFQIEESVLSSSTDNIESHYYCDVCNYKCTTKSGLGVHLKRHLLVNPYSCDRCNMIFSYKSHLSRHIRTHTGEKPFCCNKCNKTFSHSSSLSKHIGTHTGEKPYSCNKCNKSFTLKCYLNSHIRTHSGEKPFSCNKCKKSFTLKSCLNTHIRTHTGEKPYSCNTCNKTFSQNSNLVQHIRTHTGEKPYSCNKCNMSFSQRAHLSQHIRIHTGEKPYSCNKCNMSFSQSAHLSQHIRIHTGE